MRQDYLVGSAVAVLLFGATAAIFLPRSGSHPGGKANTQMTAAPAAQDRAGPGLVPQPAAPVAPSFDVVKVGPSGTAVIAGRAEPGSKVTVRDGDKVIGEVTADRRGEWVLVPDQPIGPGDRLLSLEASGPRVGATVKSDETVALSISPPKPGGKEETALAVVLPGKGTGAARVLQRPDGSLASTPAADKPLALSMDALEYDDRGRIALSGRATPGATIQIYAGNQPLATATADAAGEWSATSTRAVAPGRGELRLDQLGKDARVVQRIVVPLAQAAAAELIPGQSYTVQPGNNLWQISRRAYGVGTRYLIIYSANLSQIRDPERIYPGQVFRVPKS
ncbi:MAG: LysM peptidoglycan-binding domain-containing protein [Alphaproteobacteria bacterium]|nr:MAG: LysM peptidoglycan-binding domain-containing protein [Alphaproteobacteria bacterium]